MKRTLCLSFTLLLVMFGVSVRDSLAASVVVSWDANSESDLSGYLVSYGSNPGQYSNTVDVGNRTQWSITGLSGTSRVYVAVRAYNASGLTSPFSVEVVADFSGNQPPSIDDPGTQRSAPGAPALVQLKATDPEGTPVRYSAAGLPPGLRIDETSGLVSGTVRGHGYTRRAGYTVTLSASDVAGATASRTFEWFVDSAQLNDQPIRIIDLNADGRDDVFFYREETGEWSAAVSRAGGFTVRKGRWSTGWVVLPARLNTDAIKDYFQFNGESGEWVLMVSDGQSGFTQTAGQIEGGWTASAGDFNGDGYSDLLLYHPADGRWSVYGSFRLDLSPMMQGQWPANMSVGVTRFGSDPLDDVFLYNPVSGAWRVVIHDGSGSPREVNGQWAPGWDVHPANLNGDAFRDLVLYHSGTGAWAMAIAKADGTFTMTSGNWTPGLTVRFGDFDRNGRDEIVLSNTATGAWALCRNPATGSFSCQGGLWLPGWEIVVNDFNADGAADLFFYNHANSGWFFYDSAGRFSPTTTE
jgi:hypothetical protein